MPLIGHAKMASCPEKKDILPVRITKLSPEKGCSQTSAQSKPSPLSPEKKRQENWCFKKWVFALKVKCFLHTQRPLSKSWGIHTAHVEERMGLGHISSSAGPTLYEGREKRGSADGRCRTSCWDSACCSNSASQSWANILITTEKKNPVKCLPKLLKEVGPILASSA